MKKILFVFIASIILSSCATICDLPKKVAGYSISHFEQETKGRFELVVNYNEQKAFNKCQMFVLEKNLKINFKSEKKLYVVASHFSLIFDNCLDSTDVGFFVYKIDDNSSKIEIISNNSNLAKFVYDKVREYFK